MTEILRKNEPKTDIPAKKEEAKMPQGDSPDSAPIKHKNKKGSLLDNIKQKMSSFNLKNERSNKFLHYEETATTKVAYSFHIILTLSGRITRGLMDAYKRIFDFPEEESGNVYANLGLSFLAKSDYKQAIVAFNKSLELHPENTDAFYYLGNSLFKEKNYGEAVNAYLNAIKAGPNNASAHFELGISFAALEKYAEAVKSYEKAIAIDPDNSEFYYCSGISYDQIKDYQPAIEKFKKAIELNPRLSRYYHSLGFTYECIKQHDKAVQCFKKAVELETE